MRVVSTSRLGLLFAFTLVLFTAGCLSTAPLSHPAISTPKSHPAALIWPASGELNFVTPATCKTDCVSFQLSLTQDHLFRWRRQGSGYQQDETGRWQLDGDQLRLSGQGKQSLQLTLGDNNQLSFRKQRLQQATLSLFDLDSALLSDVVASDDSLRLAPCRTGHQWPLVNNGQSRLLRKLYATSIAASPGPRRVLARLHWTDDRQSLTIDRFLSLSPGQCDSP